MLDLAATMILEKKAIEFSWLLSMQLLDVAEDGDDIWSCSTLISVSLLEAFMGLAKALWWFRGEIWCLSTVFVVVGGDIISGGGSCGGD